MSKIDRVHVRPLVVAFSVTVAALLGMGSVALGICVPTVYTVTSSAPPPLGNWTDTSGAVWTPAGGFPGCAPGDTAADLNATATTLIINSAIPNPIIGLTMSCAGCTIDIQSGGSLTLAGAGSFSSATTIIVEPGGLLTIANGGTLTFNSGSSLSVNGGQVDLQTGGTLNLNGNSTVTNGGVLNVNGGTLNIGALFTVQSSGTLQFTAGGVTGSNTINNNGTVQMVGSGVVNVSPIFNNNSTGTVTVSSGTLALSGGGTGDGPFNINSGGTLDFPSSTYTMTNNGVVSGAGTLSVSGGTLSIGGVTTPGGFSLTAGTLTGAGFLSITNTFYWDGGTITGSGGAELAGTGVGTLSGVSGAMLLDGRTFNNYGFIAYPDAANMLHLNNNAAFNTYGTFQFQGDSDIVADGPSSVGIFPNGLMEKHTGSGVSVIQPYTTNNSTVWTTSGTIEFAGGGAHSGQFVADNDGFNPVGTIVFSGGSNGINGGAIFGSGNVAFPSGTTVFDGWLFDIGGRTSITGGTLELDSSAATTDFTLDNGELDLFADFDMYGSGTWSAGSIRYDDGTFYVDPGAMLTIDAADGIATLNGAVIDNFGTVNYTATGSVLAASVRKPVKALLASGYYLELTNSSTIYNDGLFDIKTDSPVVSTTFVIGDSLKPAGNRRRVATATALRPITTARGHVITHRARTIGVHASECVCSFGNDVENYAMLQKSAAAGTTDFGPEFGNHGDMKALSGVLNFQGDYFQDSGATTLAGGNIQSAFAMDIEGGIVDGSGTITGDVDNYGEVKPGTATTVGTIDITGNFTMGASPGSGAVTIKIAGPTAGQFDQLNITGTATLDATFNGSFINGYAPATGSTTWPVITYASHSGAFTTVNPPAYPGGSVTYAYNPTSFDLTAFTPATADVQITNSGPSSANAGATLTYTVDVSNLGPDATSGAITVIDSSTGGATPVGGSAPSGWSCSIVSGSIQCTTTSTTLASGGALPTLTFTWTAPASTANVVNTAAVQPNSVADPASPNNTASVTTSVGPQANLAITKTVISPAPPNPVNPGQNITYSILVQNNGPSAATGVTVSDPTPTGIAFLSVTGSTCTSFPCSIGTLNAGQSVTLTSMYSVPPSYSGGPIVNTASVSAVEGDPNLADNQSTTTTNVGAAADVAITKSGPPSTTLGQNITYTITVSNFGPAGATGVTVSDPTPSGLTPVSVSGGGCSVFPCSIGALAAGPPVTITATYNVPVTYSGPSTIVNTATVTSASDPNSSNDSATASTALASQADLGITKTGPASVALGQNITYTINITNSGALAAANTFVSDPTPSGVTPVSVSGGGCSAFPCAIGTINPGGSVAITATYNVPFGYASPSVSNTASVSTSSSESNTANNSATAVTPISGSGVADLSILKAGPAQASLNDFVDFTIIVTNNGPATAPNVVISDPTPANAVFISNSGGCTTPYPCAIPSLAASSQVSILSRYRVIADSGTITNTSTVTSSASDPVAANNSSTSTVKIVKGVTCPQAPILGAPLGATVASPITFTWSNVPGATYVVSITSGGTTQTINTNTNSTTQTLPNGAVTWSVQANGPNGCQATSSSSSFSVCNAPGTPVPSVVGVTTTGQTYNVEWTPTEGTTLYELQEAADASFTNPTVTNVAGTSQSFTKNVTVPTTFFYRVRAVAGCNPNAGSFSRAEPIVIIPVPPLGTLNINIPVPAGSKTPVTFPIHVPGLPNLTTSFIATVDKPWLNVSPTSGIMPPQGLDFSISADPSTLSDGTWTGTVIIVYGTAGVSGKTALDATPKTSIPVSISLTSPVSPGTLTGPAATAVVIPSVGHLPGFSSQWQSDIRIANVISSSKKVQLTFSSGSATSLAVKQTTISIDPGATTAFDDIVRNWFGIGAMNDASNGVLTVQPLDATGKPDLSVSKATVASSRTFNTSALGTLGQFIPAVPIANFISKAPGSTSTILALQQIAQTDTFHTNLGLVEATGKPASVLVSVFNGAGNKVLDIPVTLAGGEQRQLNGFLGNNGITLTNGHIEVQSTGGDGKVTAYASVIDNRTTDPLLVSGVPLGGPGASRFVIPGVASLDTGATWRSDVRIFNSSPSPQTTTLTLYPTGNPSAGVSQTTTIQPGEVKALDDIVHSTFNLTNAGGALHVTTATPAPLIVTARTFNDTAAGTLGQFLQAVTPADAVGNGDRSLQLLQMEDSPRYRTNLGLTEVTGKPATAEVTVILPDSKVAPKVQIPLAAFEYRQFSIISSLGLGNVYNARISVRVIDGQGKVTAYGSVIDQKTQDPTFVPAQ